MKAIDKFMQPLVQAIENSRGMAPDTRQRFLTDALRLLAQEVDQQPADPAFGPGDTAERLNAATRIPDLLIDNYGRVFPILKWQPTLEMECMATASIECQILLPRTPGPENNG